MGYNIGTRLIEDFLAKSTVGRCADFREVGEVVAKVRVSSIPSQLPIAFLNILHRLLAQVGFKSFLNISPTVTHGAPLPPSSPTNTASPQMLPGGSSFTLTLDENPLAEFVELPEEALEAGLWFSNILCGVLRGALEMVSTYTIYRASPYPPILTLTTKIGSDAGAGGLCFGRATRGRDH